MHNRFREAQEQAEISKLRAEKPKIQQQFADLKRGLSGVTDAEWASVPEVGNLTRKKRRCGERTYVVPDIIIVSDRGKTEFENSLYPRKRQVSPLNSTGLVTYSPSRLGFLRLQLIQC